MQAVHPRARRSARKARGPGPVFTGDAANEAEISEQITAEMQRNKEHASMLEEQQSIYEKPKALKAPYVGGGFVWVCLRKTGDAATGR